MTGEVAASLTTATGQGASNTGPSVAVPYTLKIRSGCEGGGKGALIQTDRSATLATNNDQYLFQPVTFEPGIAAREGGHIYEGVSGTIRANAGDNRMAVCYPEVVDEHILDDQGGSQISVRGDGKSPTLRAEMHGNVPCVLDSAGFKELNSAKARSDGYGEEIAPCLSANKHDACVCYSVENHPADSRVNIDESGKVQCLTSRMGTGGGNVPMVMEAIQTKVFRKGTRPHSADEAQKWEEANVANTLNTFDQGEARVYALDRASFNQGQNAKYDFEISDSGINSTITARGPSAVAYSFDSLSSNSMKSSNPHSGCRAVEVAKTLDTTSPDPSKNKGGIAIVENICLDDQGGSQISVRAYGIGNGQANQSNTEEKAGTLNCMHDQQAVLQTKPQYIVRRLTPTECARLQGFPDWWGHIAEKDELTDEEYSFWLEVRKTYDRIQADTAIETAKRVIEAEEAKSHPDPDAIKKQQEIIDRAEARKEKDYTEKQMLTWYNKLHTDGAEYKMWGNGIALPPAMYVMQGIVEALNAEKVKEETTEEPAKEINEEITEAESPLHDRNDSIDSRNYAFVALQELNTDTPEDEQRDPALPEEDNIMEEKEQKHMQIEEKTDAEQTAEIGWATEMEPPHFDALTPLYKLKDEREKLADLTGNARFTNEARALEYAVTVLEAVGL